MEKTDLYKIIKNIDNEWDKGFQREANTTAIEFNKVYARGKEGYVDPSSMFKVLMREYEKENGK